MTKIQSPPPPKNLLSVKQFSRLNKKVHKTYRNRMSTQHSGKLSCPSWRLPVETLKLCAECYATLKSPWWQGKVLLLRPCRLSFIGNKLALIPSHLHSNSCPLCRAGYTWGTGKENQKTKEIKTADWLLSVSWIVTIPSIFPSFVKVEVHSE